MLLSSRRSAGFLTKSISLRVFARPITFDAVIKSEDSLGQYVQDRKKHETPNPFKNISPIHGKKPYNENDLYNLNASNSPRSGAPKVHFFVFWAFSLFIFFAIYLIEHLYFILYIISFSLFYFIPSLIFFICFFFFFFYFIFLNLLLQFFFLSLFYGLISYLLVSSI